MRICKLLSAIFLSLVPIAGSAQFYILGDNPASVKWYSVRTAHYRIVYPAGLDSLARAYGRSLEQFRPSAGTSVGYEPGEWTWGKVPVILHAYDAVSNGSVAWAPDRVDLLTSPSAYSPDPMPWIESLTIHEQRHVAQMQVGLSPKTFRTLDYIFGQMWDGAVAGIYLTGYIEGDAVVAETALSHSGRGRTADFMNYYMIAFDNGDTRSMQRWRLGSHTKYYLDKYAYGYFFLSGMRWLYGNGSFLADYYEHMARRPYDIGGFGRVLRPQTGGLGEKKVFNAVVDTIKTMWSEEIAARAPYTPYSEVTEHERRYVEYSGGTTAGGDIYSIRSGIARPASLVKVDSTGKTHTLRAFSSVSSNLAYGSGPSLSDSASTPSAPGRLYWSEYGMDVRWGMRVNSIIRSYDPDGGLKKTKTLTRKGRLFNPSASDDGTLLSVTEYHDNGLSSILILDADTGSQLARAAAPDSLQIVQSVWLGDRIWVSALSGCGAGIYSIRLRRASFPDFEPRGMELADNEPSSPDLRPDKRRLTDNGPVSKESKGFADAATGENLSFEGPWREEMAPQPAKIDGLRSFGGNLYFSSDRLGVKELYRLTPPNHPTVPNHPADKMDGTSGGEMGGRLHRLTSSKYGADDYAFSPAGDTLYYSLKQYDGQNVVATATDSLFNVPVAPDSLYTWIIADELSRQEAELASRKASSLGLIPEGSNLSDSTLSGGFTTRVGSSANPSAVLTADPDTVRFTDPKRYRKGGHLFRIHSWAPVYFNVDNIMSLSYDYYYDLASLGVAALSQNDLGTAVTQFGYSAHKDPYDKSKWKHSGHLTFTYTGWYPVIEASVDFNDRSAMDYSYITHMNGNVNSLAVSSWQLRDAPSLSGYISLYIPFNFSRGGWSTGLIPQLTYSLGNDTLTKTSYFISSDDPRTAGYHFTRDGVTILQRLTASVRGYTMRPVPNSGIYPRWGIGAQTGVSLRPTLTEYYSPMGFLHVYGYTPGISPTQGLNLSYTLQTQLSDNAIFGDSVITTLPRGLSDNGTLSSYVSTYARSSMKFSADYALSISTGDVSIATYLLYFSRLILTPHFDYTLINWSDSSSARGNLWSAGASLTFDLRSIFWIKYPFQFGVSASYNGGSAFNSLDSTLNSYGASMSHFYVGPVFSISFN